MGIFLLVHFSTTSFCGWDGGKVMENLGLTFLGIPIQGFLRIGEVLLVAALVIGAVAGIVGWIKGR